MAENEVDFSIVSIDKATAVLNKVENEVSSFGTKIKGLADKSKSVVGSFTELNSAWMVANQIIGYGKKAYEEIIGTYLEYAGTVDELMNINGQSAEETSRLIQVTKMYGVETSTLTVAMRTLAKQGKELSVDTLARMSDEYLKLGTAEERQLYITKNLGRAGTEWGDILVTGSRNIKDQADAISDYLILSEEMVSRAEQIEASQRQLKSSTEALKLSQAGFWSETALTGTRVLTIYTKWFENLASAEYKAGAGGLSAFEQFNRAANDAIYDTAAEEYRLTQAQELADAAQELSQEYQNQLNLIQSLSTENNKYIDTQNDLNAEIADTTKKLEEAKAKYGENSKQAQEYQDKLAELSDKYAENAADHEAATKKIVYDNILQKLSVDGLTDAEFAMAQQIGVALGIIDQASADQATAINELSTMLINGQITLDEYTAAVNEGADAVQALVDKINGVQSKDVYITVHTVYETGSGSGGGANAPRIAGMRAAGGPVEAGKTYIVGEEGPEPFIPKTDGTIIPNGARGVQATGISKMDMQEAVYSAMSPIMNQLMN